MKWVGEIWAEMDGEIMHICWWISELLGEDRNAEDVTQEQERDELEEILIDVLPPRKSIGINELLH